MAQPIINAAILFDEPPALPENMPRMRGKRHLWSASWNTKMAIYVGKNSCL